MTDHIPTFSVDEIFGDEDARYAARYRLAWVSARRRARRGRALLRLTERRLKRERDEARAEVERAHARANEAARLSADARDDAEAKDAVIANLREQLGIVEGDRLNNDNWALNVLAEHNLGYNLDDLLTPIAEYLRALTAERDRLGNYANALVQKFGEVRDERDEARAEVVRLGKELEAAAAVVAEAKAAAK